MRSDEVPNTLPQNIAPWYTEYFELKEFEKTADAGISDLSPPCSLEAGPKTPMGEVPSLYPSQGQ